MLDPVESVLRSFWLKLANFIPDFFGGLLILLAGLLMATFIKKFLKTLFRFFKIEYLIKRSKILVSLRWEVWMEILLEIIGWIIILLFLIPTLEVWGLSKATGVINQFLFYLPNVIIAIIIAFIGGVVSNIAADLVHHSVGGFDKKLAKTLSFLAKAILVFFTSLIVLNQLGVAQDLIRILFTGIVAMLTIAGGLAFGLGGKDLAHDLLEELRKKLQK